MHSQSRRYFFLIKITNPLLHSTLGNDYLCFHFHISLLIWSPFGVEIAKKLPFDLENFKPFGRGKYSQTCNFRTVLIEFAPSKWQNVFQIKSQKRFLNKRLIAWTYLQLPLRQWGAGNVYLLVLYSWKVNITENSIAIMGL